MQRDQDAIQASIARHQGLSDALRISLSGQEAGSIALTPDGGLEQVYERETPEGDYELAKRAKAGVCPCCNRTFSNMAEHMKKQHADFDGKVDL
jgi:4-hydroxy-3-methylbut-2-en-1-yl diphosphate synthase IspG/GcpE